MRYKDIAVIGMSGKFASVDSIEEYRSILKDKISTIDNPPKERVELMKLPADADYMKAGYIKDITSFDNDFFEITKREARLMAPEQRMSLELVANTILDAGYSLDDFRGSNCGIYVADGFSEYSNYIEKQSSASVTGSKNFMLSGRIGYHFDLQGENITLNSGCSSSLSAIHCACEKITLGEVDSAIVGGVILYINVPKAKENEYEILGIISNDYTIKSFDENGKGTACGEGGGFVLLKELKQAQKDGDHIYGVILGGAVNGDGGRCTSVTMPSVEAQGGVVKKAWNDVGIEHLTEIEAHGIGANIGDAVEAQGLIDAAEKENIEQKSVLVSTVKPNLGHLFAMSGMSSLIKVLTGYKYNETYPIATLDNVNPLIKFSEAGLVPLKSVYHWEKTAARMTGISSFGLSGCNAHIVVKNYINQESNNEVSAFLKLSAKTLNSFERMRKSLIKYISTEQTPLNDLIYTLNTGRDDYEYRSIIPVNSLTELQNELETIKPVKITENKFKVIFVIKTEKSEDDDISKFNRVLPAIMNDGYKKTGIGDVDLKIALYKSILQMGIKKNTILLDKIFGNALKFIEGKCSEEKFRQIVEETEIDEDYSKYFEQVKLKAKGEEEIIIVDFTKSNAMSFFDGEEKIHVFNVQKPKDIEGLAKFWYENGNNINWNDYYKNCNYKRTSAPGYPFENISHWIKIKETVNEQSPQIQQTAVIKNVQPVVKNDVKLPEKKLFVMKGEILNDVDIFAYPYNNSEYKKVFSPETADIDTDYKLAMYRYITEKGIKPDIILADKRGKAVISYSKGRIDAKKLCQEAQKNINQNYNKAIEVINSFAKDFVLTIFDFGRNPILKNYKWDGNVRVVSLNEENALEEYLKNPEPQYTVQVQTESVAAPVEKKSDVQDTAEKLDIPAQSVAAKSSEIIDAEDFLEKTWIEALNLDGKIDHDEDFFSLGGNSLIIQSMSEKINNYFNKKFDVFEIYDYETIEKLAAKILEED